MPNWCGFISKPHQLVCCEAFYRKIGGLWLLFEANSTILSTFARFLDIMSIT